MYADLTEKVRFGKTLKKVREGAVRIRREEQSRAKTLSSQKASRAEIEF